MSQDGKTVAKSFIAEMNADELALRLMAIGIGLRPPPGTNATTALDEAERAWPRDPSGSFPFRRMAHAAISYLGECVENGQRPA
jgi:hypothetical protein